MRLATVGRTQLLRRSSRTPAREHPSAAAQAATPPRPACLRPGCADPGPDRQL